MKSDQDHEGLESMSYVQLKAVKMSNLKRRDLKRQYWELQVLNNVGERRYRLTVMFSKRLMCESYRKLHFIPNSEKEIRNFLQVSPTVGKGKGCSEETK